MLIFLLLLWPSAVATKLVLLNLHNHLTFNPAFILPSSGAFTGCSSGSPPKFIFASFIDTLIVESILFLLTAWRSFTSPTSTPLLTRLVRDGVFYYLVVFLMNVLPIIGYFVPVLAGPVGVSNITLGLVVVSCSRLLLSTRSVRTGYRISSVDQWSDFHFQINDTDWELDERGEATPSPIDEKRTPSDSEMLTAPGRARPRKDLEASWLAFEDSEPNRLIAALPRPQLLSIWK